MNMPRHERRPLLDIGKRPKRRTSEDWGDAIAVAIAVLAIAGIALGWLQ